MGRARRICRYARESARSPRRTCHGRSASLTTRAAGIESRSAPDRLFRSLDLNGEAIHIIHQAPGYSDADAVTHIHAAKTIYLGEVFPGDGYPEIDAAQGGKLDGLVKQLIWTNDAMHIVPARGKVTTGADVKAFRDMILTVRDRIQKMIAAGQTDDQVLAAHPTADFDAR